LKPPYEEGAVRGIMASMEPTDMVGGLESSRERSHEGGRGRQSSCDSSRGIGWGRQNIASGPPCADGLGGKISNKISEHLVSQFTDQLARQVSAHSSVNSGGGWSRQCSEAVVLSRRLTQEEVEFHTTKTVIARDAMKKIMAAEGENVFDVADGSDGLAPPSADVPEAHFKRRLLANEVLAATEDYLIGVMSNMPTLEAARIPSTTEQQRKIAKAKSCVALGYIGDEARAHPAVTKALEQAIADRSALMKAAAFGEFVEREQLKVTGKQTAHDDAIARYDSFSGRARSTPLGLMSMISTSKETSRSRDNSVCQQDLSIKSLKTPLRRASTIHDEINQLLKTDGVGMARLTPPSHEKPVLKDPMGIQCVAHLHSPKWTKLARAIRESIYDPDFYDDGTYGPMYVRLAIHGAATYDRHTRTGGLEGAAMRFKPEYSDAHNKFCKPIVKRQHELFKVPFPWASYADIQCLCSYVALECANGPVIPFTPGRRDVIMPKDLKDSNEQLEGEDFVFLNYRERGDTGCEDEPVRCPASGKSGDGCPFLRKMRVMPGRLPGPEQGHLGKPCEPVTKDAERKEMEEVAKEIRHIFVDRIGATEQLTVALIAGGHSLGRCHPEISGYAGPWQSNPGYFNNVYCKKLLSEDWKIVDRNMTDYSGDVITGLKPLGMRRQYVNKGGKGDIMMLVSDMALKEDPHFGYWIQEYACDNEKLKLDFATAFKWVTELGFDPPEEKQGFQKLLFNIRKWKADTWRWLGGICSIDVPVLAEDGPTTTVANDAPKVGNPYTMGEVSTHSTKNDCWVAINGKVCNLTQFMDLHPGGVPVIMAKAGKDATSEWNAIHNRDAIEKICPEVVVGYVVASKEGGAADVPVTSTIMGG